MPSIMSSIGHAVPRELFDEIVKHVGDEMVLEDMESKDRKDVLRHLGACALTCVYWAKTCRPKIFHSIRLRSFEDLCGLSSLVLNTPPRFPPAVLLIKSLLMVQNLDDRPWLHILRLQPSLGLTMSEAHIEFSIVGPADVNSDVGPAAFSHLATGLPRSLPPVCYLCNSLMLESLRLQPIDELRRLLRSLSFKPVDRLSSSPLRIGLVDITWYSRTPILDVLFGDRPFSLPSSPIAIMALECTDNIDAAWSAFVCAGDLHFTPSHDVSHIELSLHPSDRQSIIGISRSLYREVCAETSEAAVPFYVSRIPWRAKGLDRDEICALHFNGLAPVVVQFLSHEVGGRVYDSDQGDPIPEPNYVDAIDVSFDRLDPSIPCRSGFVPPYGSWGRVIGSFTHLRKLSLVRFTFREYFDLEQFIGYYPRWYDLKQLSNNVRVELRYCEDIRRQARLPESLAMGRFVELAKFDRHPHWQQSLRMGTPIQFEHMSWTDQVEPLYDALSHTTMSESVTPPNGHDHRQEKL